MASNKQQSNFDQGSDGTIITDQAARQITWKECQFCQIDDTITSILHQGRHLLNQSVDISNQNEAIDDAKQGTAKCATKTWKVALLSIIALCVLLGQVVILLTIILI